MEREALRGCHFHKYSALGNDYLVLDPHASAHALAPERIRALCDRHRGIGADGIVCGPEYDAAGQMRIRIFNPDGSEAEKSGNGIRIFARYAFEAGYVSREPFTLITRGGAVAVRVLDADGALIEVDMGKPSFYSADIPMTGPEREVVDEPLTVAGEQLRVTCVSMGNPHCVVFTGEVSAKRAQSLGPLLETAPCFPQRANVQLARVLSELAISIEIWERGAGYTLASGSSACAAASAARRLGLVGDSVEVWAPGGRLAVEFRPDGHAVLTGPVAGVAHGFFHADLSP
ncbi:MAG TPA: diaminopimelate epimerase [Ktedonobacterales bacterium]|nr:diaminopimelate epimerase [Ktedonobacterales bacterium]